MNTEENNNNNFSSGNSSFWEKMVSFWHENRDFGQPEPFWKKKADLVNGTVPANQLPSYVDDVIESDTFQNLPVSGEKGKIYIVTNDNTQYRWSGSGYIEINSEAEIINHLKNYWKINNDSGYKGINTDKPFSVLNNGHAQYIYSGGLLSSNFYSDSRFIPENGIHSKGFIQSDEGFQNRYYKVGQRNRIWSFANADSWGISYYQGAGLSQFLGEGIGFHFGDATDYKVYIHESGKLYTKDNVVINGNVAWHAGNFNPDNKVGTWENALALGFVNGVGDDDNYPPYIYHSTAGYVRLATQSWSSHMFLSKNGGEINGKLKIIPGIGVTSNTPTLGDGSGASFLISGDNGLWGTAIGHHSSTGEAWFQPQRFDGGNNVFGINLAPMGGTVKANGNEIWHTGNFNPESLVNALKLIDFRFDGNSIDLHDFNEGKYQFNILVNASADIDISNLKREDSIIVRNPHPFSPGIQINGSGNYIGLKEYSTTMFYMSKDGRIVMTMMGHTEIIN